MKTYLTLFFSSEGVRPSEVTKILNRMGFEALHGIYDYVYDWKRDGDVEEVVRFGDKIKYILDKLNIYYKMETV